MVKDDSPFDERQSYRPRSARAWRPWLWSITAWLRNSSIAVAFYLAVRTSTVGGLVLATFIGSFVMRQVLEATSQGD